MKRTLGRLFLGLIYGVSWLTALSNTLVLVLQLGGASFEPGRFLPMAIAAWAIIFYLHWAAGWFPFQRRF